MRMYAPLARRWVPRDPRRQCAAQRRTAANHHKLINAVDGVHLWAENFERPTADIFAVQDEIARRVADALKVTLAGKLGPGSAGTQNFEAYQLNLEAKQLLWSRQTVNSRRPCRSSAGGGARPELWRCLGRPV